VSQNVSPLPHKATESAGPRARQTWGDQG
jgi:hypothetical protein